VLEEAEDRSNPLLERLKFAAIVGSNLDEFFMVRVASLHQAIENGDQSRDLTGLTSLEQLDVVSRRTHRMVERLYQIVLDELLPALASADVRIVRWKDLDRSKRAALTATFRDTVLPVLTPLAIDATRPFPLLSSLSLNLALRLSPAPGEQEDRLAIVQVPPRLTRLVRVEEPGVFVLLEDIISAHLPELFPGQTIVEAVAVRLARDAELELDDEGGRTHLEVVERELRRRRHGGAVRLEIGAGASEQLVRRLLSQLEIRDSDVYRVRGPLDLRVLMGLVDVPGLPELRDTPRPPVNVLADVQQSDLFAFLDSRDLLLHHPYEAYDPVVALVTQAADDPEVLAIKQTLYRTSVGSPIIASLQRAAESNKQVTVLVELTARFDEERNIRWARALEEAGAHVIYGVHGYKTHAKICVVVRRTSQGIRRYVHLGTGNYNERTARLYTDFGLLTSSPTFAEDAASFFNALTGYSDPPRLKKLVMAPTELRQRFLKLIAREQRRGEAGQVAEIVAKMNSLTDEEIIRALYAASSAGVRIRLNVRGMCSLMPGIPGVSANIEVVSIVDRFLEHSRIYYFLNGGDEEIYLASADWMTRNLDKRVELMFPIEEDNQRKRVLSALRAMFRDTVKARWLDADGIYRKHPASSSEEPLRVQEYLYGDALRTATVARERAGVVLQPERSGIQKKHATPDHRTGPA
jgi:polyphosphate kinase